MDKTRLAKKDGAVPPETLLATLNLLREVFSDELITVRDRICSMTYYGAHELARSFRTVRGNTITIAEEIPEEHYGFRPAAGCRSIAETLAHIAIMPRVPAKIHVTDHVDTLVNFNFFEVMGQLQAELQVPRTKAQILELLRTEGETYSTILSGASEEFLAEQVTFPEGMEPRVKSRIEMLMSAKEHEMHHRAQLMVSQRLLGIVPHQTRQMEERMAQMRAATNA